MIFKNFLKAFYFIISFIKRIYLIFMKIQVVNIQPLRKLTLSTCENQWMGLSFHKAIFTYF